MTLRSELVKGSSYSLLLCLLEQRPMYGYQIVKELEAQSEGYFKFKEGTLYPALHRLEKQGLVTGEWQVLPNGRRRRYYNITEKGLAVLSHERNQWHDFLNAMRIMIRPKPTNP